EITFSTAPRPGELALPSDLARVLRVSPPTAPLEVNTAAGLENETADLEAEQEKEWAAASGYAVTMWRGPGGVETWGSFSLHARVTPLTEQEPGTGVYATNDDGRCLHLVSDTEEEAANPSEQAMRERRAALAGDPVFGVKRILKPRSKPFQINHY